MSELAGERVLVTGADGFIGSHLVERLVDEGARVTALCMYNSHGSYGWLDEVSPEGRGGLDLRLGDIRDARTVQDALDGVSVAFHLAALIAIPYSYLAPTSYVETNIMGTLNVLEAARDAGDVRVINTSTSEVYGTPDSIPITEAHPVRGQSPYAATKIAADQLCEAYARSFGVHVTTLRPFNTFGPRQSARAVIPTILGQLVSGVRQVKLGSLAPRRDLTYVSDTADGFMRMATTDLAPGSLIQLGTGQSVSVGELFALCCEVTGVDADVVTDDERLRPEASEVQVLLSDPARARTELGWQPTRSLADGLAETARWLRPRVNKQQAARYQR